MDVEAAATNTRYSRVSVSLSVAIEAWKAHLARVPSGNISHLKVAA